MLTSRYKLGGIPDGGQELCKVHMLSLVLIHVLLLFVDDSLVPPA